MSTNLAISYTYWEMFEIIKVVNDRYRAGQSKRTIKINFKKEAFKKSKKK